MVVVTYVLSDFLISFSFLFHLGNKETSIKKKIHVQK